MCGILGFSGPEDQALLQKLNQTQHHRGPDGEGFYFSPEDQVHLAMKRLSILDLKHGHQPMENKNQSLTIVFNGEIFNAPDLRKKLESDGVVFQTDHSDTEVLLHLYENFGRKMLSHLNGMFAFVIHDRQRRLLFGARDRFGIKPLYYAIQNQNLAFASELKTLIEFPNLSREIDPQAVYDYFSFQCVRSPQSIFRSAQKLQAAHYFIWDLREKKLELERYWSPSFGKEKLSGEELVFKIQEKLKKAVHRWVLSDVPVGCSLSGGLDSSTITALYSQNHPGIRTYSVGFPGHSDYDETELAEELAKKYKTQHQTIAIEPKDLLRELPQMVNALDEPYGGGLPSWFVFKAMAKDLKVGLTGTGGDELFGNYGKWIPYESFYRRGKRILRQVWDGHSLKGYLQFPIGYLSHIYFRDFEKRSLLFEEGFSSELSPTEAWIEEKWSPSLHPRDNIPSLDYQVQLPEEFLQMTDRFSMAHSLEARTPFLDHELVDTVLNIHPSVRTHPHDLKYLLKEAARDLLPQSYFTRPKTGFEIPLAHWIRTDLKKDLTRVSSPEYLKKQGIFQTSLQENVIKPYWMGGLRQNRHRASLIWTFYLFQLWFEQFVERRA